MACSNCLVGRGNVQCKFKFCVKCCAAHAVSGETQTKCTVITYKKRASMMLVNVEEEEVVGEEDHGDEEDNDGDDEDGREE